MLRQPPTLCLDEPTVGMHVVAKEGDRRFLVHIAGTRGTTVLLTTHDLGDVELLCPRILLVDRGRLTYDGGLAVLKEREGAHRTLHVRFAGEVNDPSADGAARLSLDGGRASFRLAAALAYGFRSLELRRCQSTGT
jgi:ABC-2 type transport system ATP-binding protein